MPNYYEPIDWNTIREECKYSEGDNNDGYIYGLYYVEGDEGQILDAEWFKTEEDRQKTIDILVKSGYNKLN